MVPGFVHWPGLLGFIFTLVTMLALIGVVPLAIALTAKPGTPRVAPSAEDELRMRYARGDIDTAELNERLAELRSTERVS